MHGGHLKLHGGKFYVRTRDIRKGATRDTSSELTFRPCHMYGLDGLSVNGLYDTFVNVLNVQSINFFPRDVRGLKTIIRHWSENIIHQRSSS